MKRVHVGRFDHLGIEAGICHEFGLAEYRDQLAEPATGERGHGHGRDDPDWAGIY
jgi:hypothetical protein